MKHNHSTYIGGFLLLIWMIVLSACQNSQEKSTSNEPAQLENSYLGQKPPGDTPIAFAPGLVTTEFYEYGGSFTPDLKEFYFIREGGKF